jgi:hypothetical protein
MDLQTIDMPEEAAKAAYEEYRDAVRAAPQAKLDEAQREYEQLDQAVMRGYKELARGNPLLKLNQTFAAGGVKEIPVVARVFIEGHRQAVESIAIVPALAITRADARSCHCLPIITGDAFELHANEWRGWGSRKADRTVIAAGTFSGADEYGSRGLELPPQPWSLQLRAIAPTIPPSLRPPHKLSGYHLLWEAEWAQEAPVAPEDPALLKHLGGDLYAVLAVWDLTELERTVLSIRAAA